MSTTDTAEAPASAWQLEPLTWARGNEGGGRPRGGLFQRCISFKA